MVKHCSSQAQRAGPEAFKLQPGQLKSNLRDTFFPAETWNKLPREVVESTSLEIFKRGWMGVCLGLLKYNEQ